MIELLSCYGFSQTIFGSTRGTNCLDNVFLNFLKENYKSEIIKVCFSDHDCQKVRMSVPEKSSNVIKRQMIRPLSNIGFHKMHNILSNLEWNFISDVNININKCFTIFQQNFLDSFLLAFPEVEVRVRDKDTCIGWFSKELKSMRNHLHLLNDLYSCFKTDKLKKEKKSFKLKYKLELKKARIKSNDNYIKKSTNPCKAGWNIYKNYKKSESTNHCSSLHADSFQNYFISFLNNNTIDDNSFSSPIDLMSSFRGKFQFTFKGVSQVTVRDEIMSLKNSKSKDFFGLSVILIKRNIDNIISPLTKLINRCLDEGVFPNCLKIAKVIPLFKKGNRDEPCNYRPISLLPVFSKVVEGIMNSQIYEYFEINNIFNDKQYGFRKKRNTSDAIVNFIKNTLRCFEDGSHCLSLFLDLTKAFDCVDHSILLDKLREYGFDDVSLSLVESYLKNRYQMVFWNGQWSRKMLIRSGVPQGSILGPLLFIVFVNDFPDFINMADSILFADDSTVTVGGSELDSLVTWSDVAQSIAKYWFSVNKLNMNANKTEKMLFSTRGVKEINKNPSVKFLGIHLDPELRWNTHIDQLSKKLSKNIFLLKCLSQFVSNKVLLSVYHGIIHSSIRYGIVAWGHCAYRHKIFALQRRAIRFVFNLSYRADCKNKFIECKVLTLPSLYIYECLLYAHKEQINCKRNRDIHSYNLRNNNDIRKDRLRLIKSQNSPLYLPFQFLNKFPHEVRELPYEKFKKSIFNYLIKNAFYSTKEFLEMDAQMQYF